MLDNTRALVTGASSGIGRATALALSREGATVAVAARRADKLEALADEIRAKGTGSLVVPTDVTSEQEVRTMVEETVAEFDGVDAIVVNAGVGRQAEIETMSTEDYRDVMAVNADGTFFTTREGLPYLRESSGHLVFVGSIAGKRPYPIDPVYGATKWWMRGFAVSVAAQVGDDDVAVSVINPTGVRTPFDAKYREPNTDRFPPGTRPEPEDIAEAIVFAIQQEPPNTIHELDFYVRDEFVD